MTYDYDKLYGSTPWALGDATKVFVDFFEERKDKKLRVLDVGCGQGRDSLFIARMGHSVVGVDLSTHGIGDLLNTTTKENLDIKGYVADIVMFIPDGAFDIILIDRTLHMLAENERLKLLERLICHAPVSGWVLIADERSNMDGFKNIMAASPNTWNIELDSRGYLFLRRS